VNCQVENTDGLAPELVLQTVVGNMKNAGRGGWEI